MTIEQNYPLDCLNTFGFSGTAEYYIQVDSERDLLAALTFAHDKGLAVHVLGGGSNILLAPFVPGLVLHMAISGRSLSEQAGSKVLTLGAGELWHQAVSWSVAQGLAGLERLALIPGTVGAAPVQNIGAYGVELRDRLKRIRAYDRSQQCFVSLRPAQCQFGYRDSLFKRCPGRYIITQISVRLDVQFYPGSLYTALAAHLARQGVQRPTLQQVFAAVCTIRQEKLPDPQQLGNAGSFFKNPVVSIDHYQRLRQRWPDIVAYPQQNGYIKLAAGWLIEQCQWKGKQCGPVGVYTKQALVLVHNGQGTLSDLLELAARIQAEVKLRFAVTLEIEPQPFPNDNHY